MLFLDSIRSLPAKILNSSTNSERPRGGSKKSARRRPLHTCGSSCVAIARKACTKAQDLDGPLGSITKTSVTVLCPFAYTMVHRCLALLLIIDDHILSLETRIEAVFPRSSCVFDCVDELARHAEGLPDNLEGTVMKIPLLKWGVVSLISCLNYLLSFVMSTRAREKEITIDVNCKEKLKAVQFEKPYSYADAARGVGNEVIHLSVKRLHSWKSRIKALEEPLSAGDSPMYSSYQSANTSPVSDCSSQEESLHPFSQLGCTYKEILERESKEEDGGDQKTYKEILERETKEEDQGEQREEKDNHHDKVVDVQTEQLNMNTAI